MVFLCFEVGPAGAGMVEAGGCVAYSSKEEARAANAAGASSESWQPAI